MTARPLIAIGGITRANAAGDGSRADSVAVIGDCSRGRKDSASRGMAEDLRTLVPQIALSLGRAVHPSSCKQEIGHSVTVHYPRVQVLRTNPFVKR